MISTDNNTEQSITDYVSAVAAHLGQIPDDERSEMLEDLRDHLREITQAEPTRPLTEVVGSPRDYANELLTSAGLANATTTTTNRTSATRARLTNALQSSSLRQYTHELSPVLRPAWWVLRAYLVSALVLAVLGAVFTGVAVREFFPVPQSFAAAVLVGALTLALIPLSVRIGSKSSTQVARIALWFANGFLVFLAIIGALNQPDQNTSYAYQETTATNANGGQCLTNSSGSVITNLYAFDSAGVLLNPVLLFDQDGRAVDNLCPDQGDSQGRQLRTQYASDLNGSSVYNAFPREQWSTATDTFTGEPLPEQVVAPPAIVIPRLAPTTTTVPTTTATPTTTVQPTTTVPAAEPTTATTPPVDPAAVPATATPAQ